MISRNLDRGRTIGELESRLIILPKKSWHVWNQDNREKVLRDERLHREEQDERAEQQRTVDREHRLDVLRRRKRMREERLDQEDDASIVAAAAATATVMKAAVVVAESDSAAASGRKQRALSLKDEETVDAVAKGAAQGLDNKGLAIPPDKVGYIEGQQHQGHVNLFGHFAEQLDRKVCNKYYAQEQAEKELRKKRAEGIAPWGFDDVKAPKQWYEKGSSSSSSTPNPTPNSASAAACNLSSSTAAAARRDGKCVPEEKAQRMQRRAERERELADPMTVFIGSAVANTASGSASTGRISRFNPAYVAPPPVTSHHHSSPISSSLSLSSSDHDGRHSRRRQSREMRKKKERRPKREKAKREEKKKEKKKGEKGRSRKKWKDSNRKRDRASLSFSPSAADSCRKDTKPSPSSPFSASLGALRQRRLEREQNEHRKAVHLLAARQRAGLSYPTDASPMLDQSEKVEMDDRKRDYNSRFFPSR